MPPKRIESARKDDILFAPQNIQNGHSKFLRVGAKLYDVPFSTLQARHTRRPLCFDIRAKSHKLNLLEQNSLVQWIFLMNLGEAAPRPATIGELISTEGSRVSVIIGDRRMFLDIAQRA